MLSSRRGRKTIVREGFGLNIVVVTCSRSEDVLFFLEMWYDHLIVYKYTRPNMCYSTAKMGIRKHFKLYT